MMIKDAGEVTQREDFQLEEVSGSHKQIRELYSVLGCRVHSISHLAMPTYSEHESFVLNHPYRVWFIVRFNGRLEGSVYLKHDNSIGINIFRPTPQCVKKVFEYIQSNFRPCPEIKSIRPSYFYINVPSSNLELQQALVALSGEVIQKSYRIPR